MPPPLSMRAIKALKTTNFISSREIHSPPRKKKREKHLRTDESNFFDHDDSEQQSPQR